MCVCVCCSFFFLSFFGGGGEGGNTLRLNYGAIHIQAFADFKLLSNIPTFSRKELVTSSLLYARKHIKHINVRHLYDKTRHSADLLSPCTSAEEGLERGLPPYDARGEVAN